MASNDDLDSFFKKKDRKGHKNKKQSALLTNNEELLKQLKNVTSAQREFVEFDENFDEFSSNVNNFPSTVVNSNEIVEVFDGKNSGSKNVSTTNKTKPMNKSSNNEKSETQKTVEQQEEWEDYEDSVDKFKELRLKLTGNQIDRSDDDEENDFYDEQDENAFENRLDGEQTEKFDRPKDKSVWKVEQITKSEKDSNVSVKISNENFQPADSKVETQKSNNSGSYRPPHLRNNAAVTIVSGKNQRFTKKDKPNIASNEEFPTLVASGNKKF